MTAELRNDFSDHATLPTPVKRAAYSDRTAWLMAILAEIAYMPFDEEANYDLTSIANALAKASGEGEIKDRLIKLVSLIEVSRNRPNQHNAILEQLLETGGFRLVKILHCPTTDTQGFVAIRPNHPQSGNGMAIVAFRGTQQVADWMTNLDAQQDPVSGIADDRTATVGKIHRGFNAAFQSVRNDMEEALRGYHDLPLYFTGHSLGGALASVATWYSKADNLAACYTFGAPRIGNDALVNRYRTPIYRVVNGCDPVPMVPPAGIGIDILKMGGRLVGTIFAPAQSVVTFLIKYQGFRHGGDQRYLTISEDYNLIEVLPNVSSFERAFRHIRRWMNGEFSRGARLDKYHAMHIYREKLGNYAKRRRRNYQRQISTHIARL